MAPPRAMWGTAALASSTAETMLMSTTFWMAESCAMGGRLKGGVGVGWPRHGGQGRRHQADGPLAGACTGEAG